MTILANHNPARLILAAGAVFIAALAVYVPLLPSGVSIGDAAEAQTVPYILGISHPTGFPAFTLAGWLFSHALTAGTVAWRMNLFSALCAALSAAGVVTLAGTFGCSAAIAALAGLAFAFGTTAFGAALLANAQPLASACSIFALAAMVGYAHGGDRRLAFAAALLTGFGLATHPSTLWIVPGLAVALAWQRAWLTPRTLALAVALVLLPLSLYAYLPIRSSIVAARHLDPAAEPPMAVIGVEWDSNQPRTLGGFLNEVLAREEKAGASLGHSLDPRHALLAVPFWFAAAGKQFGWWFLAPALAGAAILVRADRRAAAVVLAGTLGGVFFAFQYRLDSNIDRYAIVSLAATAAFAAAASRIRIPGLPPLVVPNATAALLAVVAAAAIAHNRVRPALNPFDDGASIVAAVRHDIPDGTVVVAQWNDATALGYGAYVEGVLGSRTIVPGWPTQFAGRYDTWLRTRRVIIFASPLAMLDHRVVLHLHSLPSSHVGYGVFEVLPDATRTGM